MEWFDEAIILSARPHGETGAIVTLLTPTQGRHPGLVSGGQGRNAQPTLQPGNKVQARWRARLPEHLGHLTLELLTSHAGAWLEDAEILAIMSAACAVTEASLPERQPMPGIYAALAALFSLPDPSLWGPAYVKWELGLLNALGYGLELDKCAASGASDNLVYVSPRTGRAVSSVAGEPYRDKLLVLPSFLLGEPEWEPEAIVQGLELTGYFLRTHVFAHPHSRLLVAQAGDLPQARQRLADHYRKLSTPGEAVVA